MPKSKLLKLSLFWRAYIYTHTLTHIHDSWARICYAAVAVGTTDAAFETLNYCNNWQCFRFDGAFVCVCMIMKQSFPHPSMTTNIFYYISKYCGFIVCNVCVRALTLCMCIIVSLLIMECVCVCVCGKTLLHIS